MNRKLIVHKVSKSVNRRLELIITGVLSFIHICNLKCTSLSLGLITPGSHHIKLENY